MKNLRLLKRAGLIGPQRVALVCLRVADAKCDGHSLLSGCLFFTAQHGCAKVLQQHSRANLHTEPSRCFPGQPRGGAKRSGSTDAVSYNKNSSRIEYGGPPLPRVNRRAGRPPAAMLPASILAVGVALTATLLWHCRALRSWLHKLRALALLPHPPSEHWLWGNAQALTRPDFHRRMLQCATEFGAIFSMRLIWFKVRSANAGSQSGLAFNFRTGKCVSQQGSSLRSCRGASQVVVVCDPLLVAPLLSREAALDKPFACKAFAEGYFPISVVSGGVEVAQALQAGLRLLRCPQISNRARMPNMLTQSSKSTHWRLVRKGVAPAFSQQNMRRDSFGVHSRSSWGQCTVSQERHQAAPQGMQPNQSVAMREGPLMGARGRATCSGIGSARGRQCKVWQRLGSHTCVKYCDTCSTNCTDVLKAVVCNGR